MAGINIGISEEDRAGVVDILSKLLADEYVLYTKTRNYHWNVTGSDFSEYHKMFQEQYDEIDGDIDDVAERIRSLGAPSPGTLHEFVATTRLEEEQDSQAHPSAAVMTQNLLSDHEKIIQTLRQDVVSCEKYNDVGTEDFLTGLIEKHEKTAWMLRSILE